MTRAEIDALNAAYTVYWRTREIVTQAGRVKPPCARHSQPNCCLCVPTGKQWKRRNKMAKRRQVNERKAKGPTPAMFYGIRDGSLRKLGFPDYPSYLASPRWSRIRGRVFALDEGRCRLCLGTATEIHHTSYDRHTMKGRTLRHLHSLCRSCHQKVEFEEGETERKRRTPNAMGQAVQTGIKNDRGALVRKLLDSRRQGEDLDESFRSALSRSR